MRVLLLFVLPIFAGCIMTREGVKELEQKKVVQDQVQTLQRSTAEQASRFSEINQDLRELNGRIEVLENRMNQVTLHLKDRQGGEQAINQAQEKRLTALQEELAKLEGQIVILNQEIQNFKANSAANAEAAGKNSFETAEELFEKKEYKKAILAYQRFRDHNPKHKKWPRATYKIGLCFAELGLKDEAKTFFEDVITKHPNSEEAKLAKLKLSGGEKKKKKKDG